MVKMKRIGLWLALLISMLSPALAEDLKLSGAKHWITVASSKDKDYSGMLRLILPAFDIVFLTQYIYNPRAAPVESLLAIALQIRGTAVDGARRPTLHATVRPPDALRLARAVAGSDDLICIAGSFFLAAELRPLL